MTANVGTPMTMPTKPNSPPPRRMARPIKIGLLNLMPLKEDTELQILRSLSNTPLQVDVSFITVSSHESKNLRMPGVRRQEHIVEPSYERYLAVHHLVPEHTEHFVQA